MSGFPLGSLLGLVLFSISINDMESEIQGTLSKSADGTKLSNAAKTKEGKDAIQGDLDKPETWAHENLVKFKECKCKDLHLDQGNSKHQDRLGRRSH